MSRRDTRLTGLNPLSYMGVEPVASPNLIENNRSPLPHDRKFNIGDFWINRSLSVPDIYMLVSLKNNYATWIRFATTSNVITDYVTDSGTAHQIAGLVRFIGVDSLKTTALGNTVSLDFRPLAQGYMLISDGATMGAGRLTSPGDTIAITLGDGTVDLVYKTIDGIHGDVGDAVRSGNLIAILGGTNIATHAIANTVFVVTNNLLVLAGTFTLLSNPFGVMTSTALGLTDSTNGLDGQILISSTAGLPAWRNITSSSGSLSITNSPNEIDIINVATAGISSIDGDVGTAVAIANNIQVIGGTNIVTAAAGNTLTIELATNVVLSGTLTPYGPSKGVMQVDGTGQLIATKGTLNGQTLIASTGSLPVWNRIVAGDSTVTVTNTAYGIDIKASLSTGMKTIDGDTGTATPVNGIINLYGGANIQVVARVPPTDQVYINQLPDIVISGTLTLSSTLNGVLAKAPPTYISGLSSRNSVINPNSPQTTLIGGGTAVTFAFITSARGTITFTQTASPRTLNLENNNTSIKPGNILSLVTMALTADAATLQLGSATPKLIWLATENFDPGNCWSTTYFRYTSKLSGKYNIQTCYNFNRAYDGPYSTEMQLWIQTSNRTYKTRRKETLVKSSPTSGSYLNGGMTLDVCCDLDVGDTAEMYASANFNGITYFWKLAKGDGTFFSVFYVGR